MRPTFYIRRVLPDITTPKYKSINDAEKQALRLAKEHPGEPFEILMSLGTAQTSKPQIFWNDGVNATGAEFDEEEEA